MKRTFTLIMLLLTSTFAAVARQGGATSGIDKQTVLFVANALAILSVIWIACFFLLTVIRLFLNYRLRRALVERNAPEEIIAQVLPPKDNMGHVALKWGCLFAAAGAGLTICYFSQPIGLHWAIILSFSLAVGLFVFYFIGKRFS